MGKGRKVHEAYVGVGRCEKVEETHEIDRYERFDLIELPGDTSEETIPGVEVSTNFK